MSQHRMIQLGIGALLALSLIGFDTTPIPDLVQTQELPTFDCSMVTEVPLTECEALVALYDSTDGANWYRKTDWLQIDTPCSWYGVTCSAAGHVTSLELDTNGCGARFHPNWGT